jgi:hypothetical protein
VKPKLPVILSGAYVPPRAELRYAPSVERVLLAVSEKHGVDPLRVAQGDRRKRFSRARFEFVHLVKNSWGLSWEEAGDLLNLDQSSIRYMVEKDLELRPLPAPA